jgi:hypothetical protein
MSQQTGTLAPFSNLIVRSCHQQIRSAWPQVKLLREEQGRRLELAAQLEEQQAAAESKAAELARLSEVAHSSTEDLMQAREALQQEQARAEGLAQERAELRGKVRLACREIVGPCWMAHAWKSSH